MRRRGERGMSSIVGMFLLGVMLFAGLGLLTLERQAARAGIGYEDEVRLRLLAQSEAERLAVTFERGGARAGAILTAKGTVLAQQETARDGLSCVTRAYGKDGELIVSALASCSNEDRLLSIGSYVRAKAHLRKGEEGEGYVWLGWLP